MDRRLGKTPEDYYQHYSRNNDWAVNFQNVRELPVGQIKVFFSKWGVVKDVRQTGSASGYCFVHFETKESARQCVLDLKDDSSIRLRFFNPRTAGNGDGRSNGGNNSGNSANRSEPETNGTSEKKLSLRMPLKIKPAAEILKEQKNGGLGNSDKKNNILVDSGKTNGSSTPSELKNESLSTSKLKNGSPMTPESSESRTKNPQFPNQSMNTTQIQAQPAKSSNAANGSASKPNGQSSISTNKKETAVGEPSTSVEGLKSDNLQKVTPPQIADQSSINQVVSGTEEAYKDLPELVEIYPSVENLPDLISYEQALPSPGELEDQMKNSVPAEEVIVANIHEGCPLPFILELFEKYDPICATNIVVIPAYGLRYCHVYFKSVEDAKAVEKIYDDTKIFGKNLIVLRKDSLIQKASAAR